MEVMGPDDRFGMVAFPPENPFQVVGHGLFPRRDSPKVLRPHRDELGKVHKVLTVQADNLLAHLGAKGRFPSIIRARRAVSALRPAQWLKP